MPYSPINYETLCDKHGKQQATVNYPHKSVNIGMPKNKNEKRNGGCPFCKTEKRQAQKN